MWWLSGEQRPTDYRRYGPALSGRLARALVAAASGQMIVAPDGTLGNSSPERLEGEFEQAGLLIVSGRYDPVRVAELRSVLDGPVGLAQGVQDGLDNVRPWMMTAADYNTGVTQDDDHIRLRGKPQPTPWDPELAAAMKLADQALYEEAVADALLDSLTVRRTGR